MAYTSHFTEQFPDQFAQLTDEQAFRVTQVLANGYLEGHEPTRAHVSDLIDVELGRITSEAAIAKALDRLKTGDEPRAVE